jgi:hypothetical protein
MNLDTKSETNATSADQPVSLNVAERRIVTAIANSPGKRLRIARKREVNSHLVVLGSQVWYLGDGLPDERCIYTAQTDPLGTTRYVVQSLGHKNGLSWVMSRGILTQDPTHPSGDVWMLSDRMNRQLQREAKYWADLFR